MSRVTDHLARNRQPSVTVTIMLFLVTAAGALTADRVFDVFGDHSYRMDLRG